MQLSDFDYDLPESLIAQEPVVAARRVAPARAPAGGRRPSTGRFTDLDALLAPGDLLVFNDTKVIPARLVGRKATGGKVELLLCEPLEGGLGRRWRAMGQASKPIRAGATVRARRPLRHGRGGRGRGVLRRPARPRGRGARGALARAGRVPLPPYIRREPRSADRERYQTIWARAPGSAAAPTAGLHFTERLLARLDARGVRRTAVTLHVGPGTFLPVRGESLEEHRMHPERYEVPQAAADEIAALPRARRARRRGRDDDRPDARERRRRRARRRRAPGRTELFIRPGHAFRAVDALVTNFHLPRSTLLMLVCAFGGT